MARASERVFPVYRPIAGVRFDVISEDDRSLVTVLLSEE